MLITVFQIKRLANASGWAYGTVETLSLKVVFMLTIKL